MSDADNSLPPSGNSLKRALSSLVEILNASSVLYAIIGGIATIQHGRVRATADIDVLLNVPQISMPALFKSLQEKGFDCDLNRNIRELWDDGLTTLRFADVLVDLMRPVLPVYSHVLDRAVATDILGQSVRISAIEGLIVKKLIAFRPQDEADIKDLLAAYRGRVDIEFVRAEFATIADANDPRWGKIESWLKESRNE